MKLTRCDRCCKDIMQAYQVCDGSYFDSGKEETKDFDLCLICFKALKEFFIPLPQAK